MTLFDGGGDQIWEATELAEVLGYSEACVKDLAAIGVLPSFRFAGVLMFSKAEFETWFVKVKEVVKSIDERFE